MISMHAYETSPLPKGHRLLSGPSYKEKQGFYLSSEFDRLVPPHAAWPVIKAKPRSGLPSAPYHVPKRNGSFSPSGGTESHLSNEQRRLRQDLRTVFSQNSYVPQKSYRWGRNAPSERLDLCQWLDARARLDEARFYMHDDRLPSYPLPSSSSRGQELGDADIACLATYKRGYPFGQVSLPCLLPCCAPPDGQYAESSDKRRYRDECSSPPPSPVRVPAKRPSSYTSYLGNSSRTDRDSVSSYGSSLSDASRLRSGAFSVVPPPQHRRHEKEQTPFGGFGYPQTLSYKTLCPSQPSHDERLSCSPTPTWMDEPVPGFSFEPQKDDYERYDPSMLESGLPPKLIRTRPAQEATVDDGSTASSPTTMSPAVACIGLVGLAKVANEQLGQAIAKERRRTKAKGVNNNCLHLWEFLRNMLNREVDPHSRCIEWTSRERGEFRLIKTALIADLWGQSKNRSHMTYEKMARAMRYYYKMRILEKVPNKRLHFRFGEKMLAKVLGSGGISHRQGLARDASAVFIPLSRATMNHEASAECAGDVIACRDASVEARQLQRPPPQSPVTPSGGSGSLGGSSDSDSETLCSDEQEDDSLHIDTNSDAGYDIPDSRSRGLRMHAANAVCVVEEPHPSLPALIAYRANVRV